MPFPSEMKHIDCSFEVELLRKQEGDDGDGDGPSGIVEGHASVFSNIDAHRDVIMPGAFTDTLQKRAWPVRFLWQHMPMMPIGVIRQLKEDDKGLFFKGQLALGTRTGGEAFEFLKMKAIDRVSIGFSLDDKDSFELDDKKGIRKLTKINLWEISLVTFPANPRARVDSLKNILGLLDVPELENKREIEQWLRAAGFSRAQALAMSSVWKPRDAAKDDEEEHIDVTSSETLGSGGDSETLDDVAENELAEIVSKTTNLLRGK